MEPIAEPSVLKRRSSSRLVQGRPNALPVRSSSAQRARRRPPSFLIQVFLFTLILPIIIYAGALRLSPYRLLLIVTFIPCLFAWTSGAIGKKHVPDYLFLMFSLWGGIALSVVHGMDVGLQSGAILTIETFGTYLLARRLVNNRVSFEFMVRSLFLVVVILVPFAIFETITSHKIYLEILGTIFSVPPDVAKDPRWGLSRVQGPFEHQILFGVFCSAAFGLSYYVLGYGKTIVNKLWRPSLVGVMTFLSLSSGPLSDIFVQVVLIFWDLTTRQIAYRWRILAGIFGFLYLCVASLSHRTPIEVLMDYTAFDSFTAYGRILIWDYGTVEVINHPIFGIGFNSWHHPTWMSDSMDMFWLVNAAEFGLPAAFFFTFGFFYILFKLGNKNLSSPILQDYRKGFIITMCGLFLAGWCVHFWNAVYALFMFLLGSSIWMLDAEDNSGKAIQKSEDEARPGTRRRTVMDAQSTRLGRIDRKKP